MFSCARRVLLTAIHECSPAITRHTEARPVISCLGNYAGFNDFYSSYSDASTASGYYIVSSVLHLSIQGASASSGLGLAGLMSQPQPDG